MRVLDEARAELPMVHLDHGADHFADLVEEERLALQVEAHEFDSLRIFLVRHLQTVPIHVHELICRHLHHVAHGSGLVRLDLLREVVILFGALEIGPELMQLGFLLLTKSCFVHLVDRLFTNV